MLNNSKWANQRLFGPYPPPIKANLQVQDFLHKFGFYAAFEYHKNYYILPSWEPSKRMYVLHFIPLVVTGQ